MFNPYMVLLLILLYIMCLCVSSVDVPLSGSIQLKKAQLGSVVPLDVSVCSGVDLLLSDEKIVSNCVWKGMINLTTANE